MNNHVINILHNFKKPDKEFIKDKECLICLETFDLELCNKIIKLQCECANSAYHINCITQLLESGQNKNFCPHCKKIYNMSVTAPVVEPVIEDNMRTRMFVTIIFVHIISNSLMNIINISELKEYSETDVNIVSKLLLICYFFKLLVNAWIIFKVKANAEKIESYLSLSYTIQTLLFILLICLLSSVKKDFNSIILIINNVFFYFSDLAFRIALDCRNQNRIDIN
jgi:hypothetical protein